MADQRAGDAGRATNRAPTIYDVAARAGVSHQTVTRYLAGFEGIRPATAERVKAALEELDYRPNQVARTLRSGRQKRIVVLAHALGQMGPGRVVQGAIAECRSRGYTVEIIGYESDDPGSLRDALDFVSREPLSGVLATAQTDEMRAALDAHMDGMKGRVQYQGTFLVTAGSSFKGGLLAGRHLFDLGHRSIAYLSGPEDWPVSRERLAGLRSVFDGADGVVRSVMVGDWSPASGFQAGVDFDADAGVSAVFAANDHMALGFIAAMHQRGIRIPDELSVMGFDDILEARFLMPPLTTIYDDFESEGRLSAARLIAEIEERTTTTPDDTAVEIRVRRSTAAPRP
jgi:DNA-binding LacI/PurR family transcriptional regulator